MIKRDAIPKSGWDAFFKSLEQFHIPAFDSSRLSRETNKALYVIGIYSI